MNIFLILNIHIKNENQSYNLENDLNFFWKLIMKVKLENRFFLGFSGIYQDIFRLFSRYLEIIKIIGNKSSKSWAHQQEDVPRVYELCQHKSTK